LIENYFHIKIWNFINQIFNTPGAFLAIAGTGVHHLSELGFVDLWTKWIVAALTVICTYVNKA
jgi:uncharacterized PurR-regulated membrane protein YhhQ (DUF165 family)